MSVPKHVTRAAIDFGSGAMKLVVAKLEISPPPTLPRIEKVLASIELELLLGIHVQESRAKAIGPKFAAAALPLLQDLKRVARTHGATSISGIATAVFRETLNGPAVLQKLSRKLNVPFKILSQEQEGVLGYRTAKAAKNSHDKPIVSWDSGAASFQLTTELTDQQLDAAQSSLNTEKYSIYKGPLGTSQAMALLAEVVHGRSFDSTFSANPCSMSDALELVTVLKMRLAPPPSWDLARLSRVVAIGGDTSPFRVAAMLAKPNEERQQVQQDALITLSYRDVERALNLAVERTDDDLQSLPQPSMVVPKPCLMLAVMQHIGIRSLQFTRANGCCVGLLVTESFWQET